MGTRIATGRSRDQEPTASRRGASRSDSTGASSTEGTGAPFERLLTPVDVAGVIGISVRGVRALCDRGELAFYLVSRRIRVRRTDLETFLERRRQDATP